MAWSRQKSLDRIQTLRKSVPQSAVSVRTFSAADLEARRSTIRTMKAAGQREEELVFNVRPSEAVLVDGVHVYVQLIDYQDVMIEQGRETEAGHIRVLSMLHLHYSGCDRVAEEFEAQRVDYHGPRMHAVILSPAGADAAPERALRALAFAETLKRTIGHVGRAIEGGRFATRVRIGIDSGPAVAVNSGRGNEPEPLFLGRPANYAAKLAEGDVEGIYLSDRVRRDLSLAQLGSGLVAERQADFSTLIPGVKARFAAGRATAVPMTEAVSNRAVARLIEAAANKSLATAAEFRFHRHEPPLRSIDFAQLSPADSVRMELVSLFADIDGFTAYVDECIARQRIAEMVANLHVLRGEMAASLKDDFSGRKIRFIGDCLHGLIAEGSRTDTDETKSVATAVKSAAGLRSGFELCQSVLPNITQLGLAIGLELGTTPITRLGIRGDRSVRCSSSKAVSASESLQSECDGTETALGERALAAAPAAIKRLFSNQGKARGLDYDSVEQHLAAPTIVTSGSVSRAAQPYTQDR